MLNFSKFDVLIEVSQLMKKYEPQIRYNIPTAFSDSEFIKATNSYNFVYHNTSEDQFVTQVLKIIFGSSSKDGWLAWFDYNTRAYEIFQEYLHGLTIFHRINPKIVTMDTLLKTVNDLYLYHHIPADAAKILTKMGHTGWGEAKVGNRPEDIYIQRSSQKVRGYFDSLSQYLSSDVMAGYDEGDSDPTGNIIAKGEGIIPPYLQPYLMESREFARFSIARRAPLFEISNENTKIFKKYYSIKLSNHVRDYQDFRNKINSLEVPTGIQLKTFKWVELSKLGMEENFSFESYFKKFNLITNDFFASALRGISYEEDSSPMLEQ
jgi:hypothetical protein